MTDTETGDTYPPGCVWPDCDICNVAECNSHPDNEEQEDDE